MRVVIGQKTHKGSGIATRDVTLLLALCMARSQNCLRQFIEQQLDMVPETGMIGGCAVGVRATVFAAAEAGYLDWCHRTLTDEYSAKTKAERRKLKYEKIQEMEMKVEEEVVV